MTVLWAANATKHSAVAFYRDGIEYCAPNVRGGQQIRLFEGTDDECLAVAAQLDATAADIAKAGPQNEVWLWLYSFDTPIPDETIRKVILRNTQLLSDKGYLSRVGITAPVAPPESQPDEPAAEESTEPS